MDEKTLDTRSYLIGRYDGLRELTDEEIKNIHEETSWLGITDPIKFAKAILKKAREKMINNINEPNPFIGWEKNLTPVDTNPNSGLGGKALKKASEK